MQASAAGQDTAVNWLALAPVGARVTTVTHPEMPSASLSGTGLPTLSVCTPTARQRPWEGPAMALNWLPLAFGGSGVCWIAHPDPFQRSASGTVVPAWFT